MQEENEDEVVRVPVERYKFHTCPVCDIMARFPEDSKLFKYFGVIEALVNKVKEE
jgi:hypothetical protein